MIGISIRSANLNDMCTLLEFEQCIIATERLYDNCLKDEPISYYNLKELILSETAEVLVAEIDHKVVGSGYAQIRESKSYLKHDRHSYLGFMYVDPSFRGNGINKLILNYLKEWSQLREVHHLSLDVYAGNQMAIRAYEKSGFKKNLIEMSVSLKENT